jgi:hypothetical protein
MSIPIYVAGAVVVGIFLYRFLYGTETPHIKGLPEVPGLPLFGSLFELGTNHAKVAQGWAKKYGPVFQVRMGNKVRTTKFEAKSAETDTSITENRLCQLVRLCPPSLDHKSIRTDLTSHAPHFSQSRLLIPGFHNWHFSMGRVLQESPESSCDRTESPSCSIVHASHRPRVLCVY